MNLLLILILYLIFLLISLVYAKRRLIAPSVLFFGSFSAMLVTANILNWYLRLKLKDETFWLMAVSGFVFFLVEQTYRLATQTKRQSKGICQDDWLQRSKELRPIIVQPFLQNVLVAFMFLSVSVALFYAFSFSGRSSSWNEMMQIYREDKASVSSMTGWTYSLLGQMINLATAIVYICSYILVYNKRVCSLPLKRQKKLICVDLLFIPMTLIGLGIRQSSVELVLFVFLSVFILMPVSQKKLPFWKLVLLGMIFLIAFILIFTWIAAFVGRVDKYRNPFLYITDYLCGGIMNLNNGIKHYKINEYWGQESFAGVYRFLAKYGLVPADVVMGVHTNGWAGEYASSTTVTIYGRWFEDFGAIGVYVMTGVIAFVFSWLYYSKCNIRPAPNKYHVIYIWFSMVLVWAAYDDRVFNLITVGTIIQLIWVSFLYWLLIGRGRRYVFTFGKKRSVLNSVSTLTIQGRENNR